MLVSNKEDLLKYIPQRDPIVMVDSLVSIDGDKVTTQLLVQEGNIFITNQNKVSYYGVLEHIAQSYALTHGYLFGSDIGMIGKISKLTTYFEPYINKPIKTKIEIINNMGNMVLINASSYQEDSLILSCEMYLHFNSN